jgi:hypothetical protein
MKLVVLSVLLNVALFSGVNAQFVLRSLPTTNSQNVPRAQLLKLHRLFARQSSCPADSTACSFGGCCAGNTTCATVNNVEGCCPAGGNCGQQSNNGNSNTNSNSGSCGSGDFLCSDASGCCPIGNTCVSLKGQTGCCPAGSSCQGSTIGASQQSTSAPAPAPATTTPAASPTSGASQGCQSGYFSCTNGAGCCPNGSQVLFSCLVFEWVLRIVYDG